MASQYSSPPTGSKRKRPEEPQYRQRRRAPSDDEEEDNDGEEEGEEDGEEEDGEDEDEADERPRNGRVSEDNYYDATPQPTTQADEAPQQEAPQPSQMQRPDDLFDWDQPIEERRRLQAEYRQLLQTINENQEEYMKPESRGIEETLRRAGELAKQLKVTSDATMDSRLLVATADLAIRKAKRLTQGNNLEEMTPDEFVTRLARFMRKGDREERGVGGASTSEEEDDDEQNNGDAYNWAFLGRHCIPHINRVMLPTFLVGPLSLEKRARKVGKRTAPLRTSTLQETRPEILRAEDLAKSQDTLANTCGRILQTLQRLQGEIQERLSEEIGDDMDEKEATALMVKYGMRSTGGVDLMRFVVNPVSFSQTVENVFYVSFLVRDGKVVLEMDENGIYSVAPAPEADQDQGDQGDRGTQANGGTTKHQAILSIDERTWRDIVETLAIEAPMIEHRKETAHTGPGARGWYS